MGDLRFKFYLFTSLFLLIILLISLSSADMNSSNYKIKSSISSNTGGNSTSSNFIANTIIGIISGNIFSNSFNNYVGFFQSTVTDTTPPEILFVDPTPANSSISIGNSILVNVSVNDTNYVSSFIDFDNSLVSWWRMDDANATSVFDYMGRNNGTILNSTQTNAGYLGKGFYFNRDLPTPAVYVTPSQTIAIANKTILAWVKRGSLGHWSIILGRCSGDWYFGINNANNIIVSYANASGNQVTYAPISVADTSWHFVGVNIFQNGPAINISIYKDASVSSTLITQGITSNLQTVYIGSMNNNCGVTGGTVFNGSIDDVIIFNRSLSTNEVMALYANTSSKYYYNNFTSLTDRNYTFKAYGQDIIGNVNSTETRTIIVSMNHAPYNGTVLVLNSTLGLNRTLEDLNVQTTLLDKNNNSVNVTVFWFNNSIKHLTLLYNSSYANASSFVSTLGHGNTSKGQNWSVGIVLNDGMRSFMVNSTNLTVLNTPPNATLIAPIDNSITFNRTTQIFTWAVSDADGDIPTQSRLNISLIASSSCTDSYFDGSDIYEPEDLESFSLSLLFLTFNCLSDNNDYYKWSVSATDGSSYGSYTNPFNLSVQALLSTTMNISAVEFGNLAYLKSNNTITNSPKPLIIINQGNALSNIGVHATNLWQSISNPSTYYRFKFDNVTTNGISENGSFIWNQSTVTFTDVPLIQTTGLTDLNYSDATDSSEIDINVTVPSTEGPGVRTSTITFTVSLGDGDTY